MEFFSNRQQHGRFPKQLFVTFSDFDQVAANPLLCQNGDFFSCACNLCPSRHPSIIPITSSPPSSLVLFPYPRDFTSIVIVGIQVRPSSSQHKISTFSLDPKLPLHERISFSYVRKEDFFAAGGGGKERKTSFSSLSLWPDFHMKIEFPLLSLFLHRLLL